MAEKLYFRYGTMGSGKSMELLRTAYNYKERNLNTFILTSSLDNRYGIGKVATRIDGFMEDAEIINKETDLFNLISVKNITEKINCVLIDEAQFLSKEQVWQLTNVVDELNIPVMCYGLKVDYMGEPFEGSKYLLTLADISDEIRTICDCGRKATMVIRYVDGEPVFEGEQIIIGGNEKYKPVCRKCWKKIRNYNISKK